jgi:hypothetical protein
MIFLLKVATTCFKKKILLPNSPYYHIHYFSPIYIEITHHTIEIYLFMF